MSLNKIRYGFSVLLALTLNVQALVINFTEVGYTNVAAVSAGSISVSGTAASTVYTISGIDLDGDDTLDPFSIHVDISSSSGSVGWNASVGEYQVGGNSITPPEEMTVQYAGVSGMLSGGGTVEVNDFRFNEISMRRWQSGDAYTITQSGVTSAVSTSKRFALNDDDFTVTGTGGSFNPEHFNFSVEIDSPHLNDGLDSFDTGYTITLVRTAESNGTFVVGSSFEGTVLGMSTEGTMLWTNELSGFVNHDLCCGDLTGDGVDEILAANADGSIYCLDSSGALQWQFKTNAALMNAVCVIHDEEQTPYVVCGGFDLSFYYLTTNGMPVKKIHSTTYSEDSTWGEDAPPAGEHNVNFLRVLKHPDGSEDLLLNSTIGWGSKGYLYWFDPLADLPYQTDRASSPGFISQYDTNGDGLDEFLMGTSGHRDSANFTTFDPASRTLTNFPITALSFGDTHYKVTEPVVITNGVSWQYFVLHGHHILLVPPDLALDTTEILECSYSFYDIWRDPISGKLIIASAQSGGSCIHMLDPTNPLWKSAYINIEPPGKIASILANTESVWSNLTTFVKPEWEPDSQSVYLMVDPDLGTQADHFHDITNHYDNPVMLNWFGALKKESLAWRADPANGFDNLEYLDRTKNGTNNYVLSQQEAVDQFLPNYPGHPGIAGWFGHGNDPNWYQPQTLRMLIDAAAGKKTVMLWPETGADSSTNFTFVLNYLFYPVATHAQGKNAIVYFRSKSPQWQSDVYRPHWKRFLSGEFSDVFVPALEETGTRSPDLSVAGRMGLWASGAADSWGARTVPDNYSYYGARKHCNQRLLNHFLRNSIYNIACGAQYINNFDSADEYMSILWDLIAKGALYVPKRSELVSLSPVFLGMREPDPRFDGSDRQEKFNTWYDETWEPNNPMVISRKGTEWAGSPVHEWDFSRYASGVHERRCDFLPRHPHGLVMIAPPQTGAFSDPTAPRGKMTDHIHPLYRNIMQQFISDGRNYYSTDGTQTYGAETYYQTVETAITNAARQLPLTVSGDVAWVCAQTDPTHLRLTLIDRGYLNPQKRTATITFHTVTPVEMTDLLDRKSFAVASDTATVDVPLGLFRFIDIELREPFFPENGWGEFASRHGLCGRAQADSDSDGQSDLYEYALGGNPTNSASAAPGLSLQITTDSISLFNLQPAHPEPGISVVAEWTDHLVNGTWKEDWTQEITGPSGALNYQRIERQLDPPFQSNLFFRLNIMQP